MRHRGDRRSRRADQRRPPGAAATRRRTMTRRLALVLALSLPAGTAAAQEPNLVGRHQHHARVPPVARCPDPVLPAMDVGGVRLRALRASSRLPLQLPRVGRPRRLSLDGNANWEGCGSSSSAAESVSAAARQEAIGFVTAW